MEQPLGSATAAPVLSAAYPGGGLVGLQSRQIVTMQQIVEQREWEAVTNYRIIRSNLIGHETRIQKQAQRRVKVSQINGTRLSELNPMTTKSLNDWKHARAETIASGLKQKDDGKKRRLTEDEKLLQFYEKGFREKTQNGNQLSVQSGGSIPKQISPFDVALYRNTLETDSIIRTRVGNPLGLKNPGQDLDSRFSSESHLYACTRNLLDPKRKTRFGILPHELFTEDAAIELICYLARSAQQVLSDARAVAGSSCMRPVSNSGHCVTVSDIQEALVAFHGRNATILPSPAENLASVDETPFVFTSALYAENEGVLRKTSQKFQELLKESGNAGADVENQMMSGRAYTHPFADAISNSFLKTLVRDPVSSALLDGSGTKAAPASGSALARVPTDRAVDLLVR